MEWIFLWVAFSVVAGIAASIRGRFGSGYFMLALVISPLIVLILVLVMANLRQERARETEVMNSRECPYCAELVRRQAVVCRHCRADLEPLPALPFWQLYPTAPAMVVVIIVIGVIIYSERRKPAPPVDATALSSAPVVMQPQKQTKQNAASPRPVAKRASAPEPNAPLSLAPPIPRRP